MSDPHYPTIDTSVFDDWILKSGKVEDTIIQVGDTKAFVVLGRQAIHKRIIIIRELGTGQISFEFATAIAIRLGFMGKLLKWLEENKNWKDGGYTENEL